MDRAPFIVALALALGCARNADLEVEVVAPPAPSGEQLWMTVEFEREAPGIGFRDEWGARNPHPPVLLQDRAQTVAYSVLSEDASLVLLVRARFCGDADCSRLADSASQAPGLWFRLDHPFYIGHRTRWTTTIETVPTGQPTDPITVDRCAIEGCIEPSGAGGNFCRTSGRHFCEGE